MVSLRLTAVLCGCFAGALQVLCPKIVPKIRTMARSALIQLFGLRGVTQFHQGMAYSFNGKYSFCLVQELQLEIGPSVLFVLLPCTQ